MPLAHHMGAQLREFSFAKMRKALKQFFAGDECENRIAKKLQLLVVVDLKFVLARLLRFLPRAPGSYE